MRFSFSKNISLLSLIIISACKIAGEKREIPKNDSVLISYLISNQYVIDDALYKKLFTNFYAGIGAANPTSNADYWVTPPSGCVETALLDDYKMSELQLRRLIEVDSLEIKNSASQRTPLKLNALNIFNSYVLPSAILETGSYALISSGVQGGALKFEQNFEILGSGSELTLHNFDEHDEHISSTPLASPNIPTPDQDSYRLVFDRQNYNALSFNAPEGTNYVKLRIKDGSNLLEGDLTCLSKPDELIVIPKGKLSTFKTTEEGFLELEFVSTSKITNINRLNYGFTVSSTKHIQGTFSFFDTNNNKHTRNVGLVQIR